MPDERIFKMPRYIFLSPRLSKDGITVDDIRAALAEAMADRDRLYLFHGFITDERGQRICWQLEVPDDGLPTVTEFFLSCRREDEDFYPQVDPYRFWELPDYRPPQSNR